jgi:hypothetical protein
MHKNRKIMKIDKIRIEKKNEININNKKVKTQKL